MMKKITAAIALSLFLTNSHAVEEYRGDIVTVETVSQQDTVVLGGTVVPARQVMIAAQLPGRVEFIAGSEGDSFKEETILVALDDDELLAQRRAALAQMANAEAALRNAGIQFNRELISPQSRKSMGGMGMPGMFDQMFTKNFSDMMGINDSGMDRHADLISRRTGIDQARGSYTQATSQLEQVDAKLRDAVGYAPFDGVIIEKLVEVGDTIQPGQPLLKYADVNALQIEIQVPARIMPGVRVGDIVSATLDVNQTTVKAKITQIFPMADPIRHTVTVKLDLPVNAPAAPGMYADVTITDRNSPANKITVIPKTALLKRGSLPVVYVLNDQGEKEMRVVRKGLNLEGDRVTILSGLRGGERVINNPRPGIAAKR
jgi:multidrug efflux pump subunit AcrA (membrane-fusion protein)